MLFSRQDISESAVRTGQKRESGEKPERSGHCKRRSDIYENHCRKVRREDGAQSISRNRESGNLLSDQGELPMKADPEYSCVEKCQPGFMISAAADNARFRACLPGAEGCLTV